MALTRLEYEKTWLSSGDFPTYEDSEQQVRADMQYHPDAVRDYLNGTLIPELEGNGGSGHIGDPRGGSVRVALDQVDGTLEEHRQAILNLAAGTPPEAVRAARVDFGLEDWAAPGEGADPALRIGREAHGRYNGDFGYSLCERVDGESRSGSWNVQGTDVGYDSETGDVVLTAEEAYAGSIVFFGV